MKTEEINREKTHKENCFISFKSNEDIKKENEERRAKINEFNNGLRGVAHNPKDSELTMVMGPYANNDTRF